MFRIFFAFPEERQKVSTLFEGTNWTNTEKRVRLKMARVGSQIPFFTKAPFYSNKSECVPVRMKQSSLPSTR